MFRLTLAMLSALVLAACEPAAAQHTAPAPATTAAHSPAASPPTVAHDRWKMQPGKVEITGDGRIKGSFALMPDGNGHASRRGGACLIYQYRDAATCTENAQCGVGGYCPSGTCWSKVEEAKGPCDRKPAEDRVPFKDEGLPTVGADLDHNPLQRDVAVRWQTVACQNLTDMGCGTGMEGINKKTVFGKPTKWMDP